MIRINTSGWLTSSIFARYPYIRHGFSTRALLDARNDTVRATMMTQWNMPLVRGEQIHAAHVEVIRNDSKLIYAATDALVTSTPNVAVGVLTADCVPILLADPEHRSIGVVHAGWRGLISGILEATIDTMVREGAELEGMLACIGPHIGACCYQIPEERARIFANRFHDETVSGVNGSGWFIDIGKASYTILLEKGLRKNMIDTSVFCTSCQHDVFYSYRKDSHETFGEQLSFIALT